MYGLDGRKLRMRRGFDGNIETHKALNTLLQGAGAVIMKQALINLWPVDDIVINYHDEFQLDVNPSVAEQRGEDIRMAIIKAGEDFDLNIPLDAEYSIGLNWAETH